MSVLSKTHTVAVIYGYYVDGADSFLSFVLLGIRFTSYHGNFMLRSTDLLALPAVDCDKAYGMQLSLEETLLSTQTVYFQVALLYPLELEISIHLKSKLQIDAYVMAVHA